jgi:hypothetical protein
MTNDQTVTQAGQIPGDVWAEVDAVAGRVGNNELEYAECVDRLRCALAQQLHLHRTAHSGEDGYKVFDPMQADKAAMREMTRQTDALNAAHSGEGRSNGAGEVDADELADLIESLRAENARLKSEAASMWRGGVSNTVAVVDQVRNKFAKGLKLKKNVRLAHFDAELDIALGEWFNATRCISPTSYHESEDVFRALAKIKGGPDAR